MRDPASFPEETLPVRALRRVGAGWAALGIAGFLLFIVALAALLGYRAGLAKHADLAATETANEVARQYELGLADLEAGHLLTAGERFRYVLSLEPGHAGAAQGLAEVERRMSLATDAPAPEAGGAAATPPAELLAQAEAALAASDWDGALALLTALQQADANYEAGRAQANLHTAYRERGLARIADYRLQEGILDLDRAEQYGALDADTDARRLWATLYLRGSALLGVDWQSATLIFEDLYRAAPYFHDTISKLHAAHVGYGDQLWAQGDPCAAAQEYARAVEVLEDAAASGKQQAAQTECEAGTPTPEGAEGEPTPGEDGGQTGGG